MNFQALLNPFQSLPPISSSFSQLPARKPPQPKKTNKSINIFIPSPIQYLTHFLSLPTKDEISIKHIDDVNEKTNSHSRSSEPMPTPIDLVTSKPRLQNLRLNQSPSLNHQRSLLSPTTLSLRRPLSPPVTDATEGNHPLQSVILRETETFYRYKTW